MRLLPLLLLFACTTSETDVDVVPETDTEVDSEVEDTDPPFEFDEEALITAAEVLALEAPRFDMPPVFAMLDDFETSTDPDCPGEDASPRGGGVHHDCTTDGGTRIWGRYVWLDTAVDLLVAFARDVMLDPIVPLLEPGWVEGDPFSVGEFVGVDGNFIMDRGYEQLEFSGEYYDVELDGAGVEIRLFGFLGPLTHPGAASDTWIGRGLVPEFETAWMTYQGNSLRVVHGGLAGLTPEYPSVYAHQLVAMTGPDATCDAEPTGTISVRDAAGDWLDLEFGENCDGCADVMRAGVAVGTVCPDMSALLNPPAAMEFP